MTFMLYKTRLRCLIKDKSNILWTLLFPIILATFFKMAFANILSSESFQTIKIAVVANEEYRNDTNFRNDLKNAKISENKNSSNMFDVTECTEEEAKKYLDDNSVIGYIVPGEYIQLIVKSSGIEESIVKSFLDSYSQTVNTITSIVASNPNAISTINESVSNYENYLTDGSRSSKNPDPTLIFFYALIAMACLFGYEWGQKEITNIQADLSVKGARIDVAPVHKSKLLLCNLFAAYTIHFSGIVILLVYINQILKIDFGDNTTYIFLTCILGSLLGISFGSMFNAVVKKNEETKKAFMSAIVMIGSFLSGLMIIDIKYLIAEKCPILGYLNPANLITDAFYSLYYYDTYEKFYLNAGLMVGFSILFCVLTYLATRRRQYASI